MKLYGDDCGFKTLCILPLDKDTNFIERRHPSPSVTLPEMVPGEGKAIELVA